MPPRAPISKSPDLFGFGSGETTRHFRESSRATCQHLPTDLSTSLAALPDQELERLLTAVTQEANRRGKEVKSETPTPRRKALTRQIKGPTRADDKITAGKANLVRAAFQAGVEPRSIARQFGLTYNAVREILG
jgi:hypothetical protein